MSEPLNILSIEDSNADFLMVERHLKQNGLSVRCHRVDSLIALKEAIDKNNWDLVLADYNIPQIDFQDSLSLLLAGLKHVPIIMVTGSLGEEKAVELLKLGVQDFVLKGSLVRLVQAIERSLREALEHKAKVVAEEELRDSNESFRMIYEYSIDAIMLTNTDGSVLAANPEACSVFGMNETEICRVGCSGLVDVEDARFLVLLEERKCTGRYRGEITMKRGDGSSFPVEVSSAVFSECDGVQKTSLIIRDITERKKLEEQIRQAQKMEAVGQMAGGVAHDFNNILQAVLGYAHLILAKAEDNAPIKHYVEELLKASNRAADLTKRLLTFSRIQPLTLAVLDISKVIMENEAFLGRMIREDIELKVICTGEPLTILADRGQIEQVIMNLVVNARDAMPSGGQLVIETHYMIMDQEFIETHGYGRAGAYALLSVSDSGVGMDKGTQSHLFEPFFTTKEQGKGTGLGLSISYGIVKQHEGFISVCSEPGNGTIITFYLPLVQAKAQVGNMESSNVAPLRGEGENILVCEDDAALLRLYTKVLNRSGYCVVEAVNGQDAVDKFIKYGDSIQLVILDEIMPKKSGRDAFKEMRLVRPDLKAVFVSGYTLDIAADGSVLDGNSVFIKKPVSIDELLAIVRGMLDEKKSISPAQPIDCSGYDV